MAEDDDDDDSVTFFPNRNVTLTYICVLTVTDRAVTTGI